MGKITILPESLINHIAAGEVVERPSSVVKELVENAIDSGADQIFVTIKNGGKDQIQVLDNGSGMSEEDALLAVERHATSKIGEIDDLGRIMTLGFRGEALAAISAVSRFELTTCADETQGGFQLRLEGGSIKHRARIGFPKGTRVNIENLFFNTPARLKFMKATQTEYHHIHELILRLGLSHPEIQFRLTHDKKVVLNLLKAQNFKQRAKDCFGAEIVDPLIECEHEESYLKFSGLFSPPEACRNSKRWQHTLVNGRYVICKTIQHGILEGYKTLLMKNTHPVYFVNVELSPAEIDVNVHPAKTEIRIKNPSLIHTIFGQEIARLLKRGVRKKYFDSPEITQDMVRDYRASESLKADYGQKETKAPRTFVEPSQQMGFSSGPGTGQKPVAARPSPQTDQEAFFFAEAQSTDRSQMGQQGQGSYLALAQLHKKYILAQGAEKLLLVDQHAAHERIRFEEIKNQFYDNRIATHPLMVPVLMELPPQDGLLLEQHSESWEKLGFSVQHFGGNDYAIKEIPLLLKDKNIAAVIKAVLDEMAQFGRSGKLEIFYNEVFEKVACHSAIRAGQALSLPEMQSMLDLLEGLDLQVYCPHGRPVMVEFSLNELDRRFKRLV